MSWRAGSQRGQATVELVGLLPIVLAVSLAVFALLAAGRAGELAANAAGAGAVALLQDGDPEEAARAALPGRSGRDVRIVVSRRVVTVTVRPRLPVPGLASALAATRRADAGPEPGP